MKTTRLQDNKRIKSYETVPDLLALMLRVCSLAGETFATFSAEEVEDKSVLQLKSSLAKQIGVTRFRQRWFTEDQTELCDDAAVPCCEVQLVLLSFVQAEGDELDELVSACGENRPERVIDLLRKPMNPDGIPDREAFLHSLRVASENGHLQIVQLLLEAGTDAFVVDRDFQRRTALHLAAANGHAEVVKLLLEAGARKDAADEDGNTALHLATGNGHLEVVRLLLEAGADKDAQGEFEMTALDFAAEAGHSEVVKLLLEAGCCKLGPTKMWLIRKGNCLLTWLLRR